VGQLLKKLDDLGIADNTIVVFMTDNGAEFFTWPDGGTTIFRGEKNTSWEGGYRSPCVMRRPGVIKPGTVYNDIVSNEDLLPTFLAAVGDGRVKDDLLKGKQVGTKTFKVHLDGYNLLPFFKGEVAESPRKEFLYWTDDGGLAALRYGNWKVLFLEQRAVGFEVWAEPFVPLRWPRVINLRMDPLERAKDEAPGWIQWSAQRMFVLVPAQAFVAQWLSSFKEFPPRQKPESFSVDQVMEKLTSAPAGSHQ
jgi:arylsulfatase